MEGIGSFRIPKNKLILVASLLEQRKYSRV